jgi:hypothetical protein
MHLLEFIAEQKLAAAARDGEFDCLPGAGKPLVLDDDTHIPEDMRAAYRILKNSGFVPPEVQSLNEIARLEAVLRAEVSEDERLAVLRKIEMLRIVADERKRVEGRR